MLPTANSLGKINVFYWMTLLYLYMCVCVCVYVCIYVYMRTDIVDTINGADYPLTAFIIHLVR